MKLRVRLVPGSSRTGFVEQMADGVLKIAVKAAPVQGKANAEAVRWLAGEFGVRRSSVVITSGFSSRTKSIRIDNPEKEPGWFHG
ncbi:hypothetical protein CSA37_08205 [Candidatus Fermentibacteria bacterium]|nr:MAG: hypothetical protein CSA37_08205 [Candidatus Fermentibacteria bacterium]